MITFFLITGIIGFVVSAISIEVWSGGKRAQNSFETENEASRKIRAKVALVSALCGLASFGVAAMMVLT